MNANRRLGKLEAQLQSEKKDGINCHEDFIEALENYRRKGIPIPWRSTPYLIRLEKLHREAAEREKVPAVTASGAERRSHDQPH